MARLSAFLFTTAAGRAVPAAFFGGFARRRPHRARITALSLGFAVGAQHLVVVFFNKLFKFPAAYGALIL